MTAGAVPVGTTQGAGLPRLLRSGPATAGRRPPLTGGPVSVEDIDHRQTGGCPVVVEELMLECGVIVSHGTVRRWCATFCRAHANELRSRRPGPGNTWHLDEVLIEINGERHHPWRAVDQHGD